MANKEYRLRNKAGEVSEHDQNELSKYVNRFRLSNSEAVCIGGVIFLPNENPGIDDLSKMKIKSVEKVRIDYISKLNQEELEGTLKQLQKQYDLKQGQLSKITSEMNKIRKDLAEDSKNIEHLKQILIEITVRSVNNRQVKNYIAKVENYCDKLTDSLNIDDPEKLTDDNKKEVLNKLDVLESYINDLKGRFGI